MSTPPAGARTGKHAREATAGGMGAVPTPANNRDPVNNRDPSHLRRSEYDASGPLEGIPQEEMPETGHYSNPSTGTSGHNTNEGEDHSFANRKPGSKGLMGQWMERYGSLFVL